MSSSVVKVTRQIHALLTGKARPRLGQRYLQLQLLHFVVKIQYLLLGFRERRLLFGAIPIRDTLHLDVVHFNQDVLELPLQNGATSESTRIIRVNPQNKRVRLLVFALNMPPDC